MGNKKLVANVEVPCKGQRRIRDSVIVPPDHLVRVKGWEKDGTDPTGCDYSLKHEETTYCNPGKETDIKKFKTLKKCILCTEGIIGKELATLTKCHCKGRGNMANPEDAITEDHIVLMVGWGNGDTSQLGCEHAIKHKETIRCCPGKLSKVKDRNTLMKCILCTEG